jgi:hypothetical protein
MHVVLRAHQPFCAASDRETFALFVCIAGVGYLMAQRLPRLSAQKSVPGSPCLPLDAAAALPRCWCNGYRYSDACGQLRELKEICGPLEGIVVVKKTGRGLGLTGGEIARFRRLAPVGGWVEV